MKLGSMVRGFVYPLHSFVASKRLTLRRNSTFPSCRDLSQGNPCRTLLPLLVPPRSLDVNSSMFTTTTSRRLTTSNLTTTLRSYRTATISAAHHLGLPTTGLKFLYGEISHPSLPPYNRSEVSVPFASSSIIL